MSGVDMAAACYGKGATDAIVRLFENKRHGSRNPEAATPNNFSTKGGTPCAVADGRRVLGLVTWKDIVKG